MANATTTPASTLAPTPISALILLEPGTYLLMVLAVCSIMYGSYRCRALVGSGSAASIQLGEVLEMSWLTTLIFPLSASVMLVLLFYILASMYMLIFLLVILITLVCTLLVLQPVGDSLVPYVLKVIPKKDVQDYLGLGLGVVTWIALLAVWLFTHGGWYVGDPLALMVVVAAITHMRVPTLAMSMGLLGAMWVYDITWTLLSPLVFGSSVMEHVARQMSGGWAPMPVVITVPHLLTGGSTALGLSDVVIPGLYVCFLYRWDAHKERVAWESSLTRAALAGYAVGFFLTVVFLVLLQKAQPALMYILPCVVASSLGYAHFVFAEVPELWKYVPADDLYTAVGENAALNAVNANAIL
jgi:signal peptide peptidase-like protein 2B